MSDAIARLIGIDKILESFEIEAETPYWSIWDKGKKMSQYNGNRGDDMDASIEKLTNVLNTCSDYTRPLVLVLHTKKENAYTNKSEYTSSLYCLPKEKQSIPATPGTDLNNYVLMRELESLKTEISALKSVQLQEDNDDDDDDDDGIGGFQKILDHPIIIGLANRFMGGGNTHATHLAGVNKNIDEILNVLFAKGVTVEHLQILSEMPESKLKMLISML
jgi:hypothetical protein